LKIGGMAILRVISGSARGHKLKTPEGDSTRPTSDRVKESLFNILTPYIAGAHVLDLFAGTGNLGIEALSRGAEHAVFVDRSHVCFRIINENLEHTKLKDKATVIAGDVAGSIKKLHDQSKKFDIIFMDPPYNKNLVDDTINILTKNDIMKADGIIVAEMDIDDKVSERYGPFKLTRSRKYGDTVLAFYVKTDDI